MTWLTRGLVKEVVCPGFDVEETYTIETTTAMGLVAKQGDHMLVGFTKGETSDEDMYTCACGMLFTRGIAVKRVVV